MIFNFTKIPSSTTNPVIIPTIPTGYFGFRIVIPSGGDAYSRLIRLPRKNESFYNYTYTVYWGDGTSDVSAGYMDEEGSVHSYATSGTYDIIINGVYNYFYIATYEDSVVNVGRLQNYITHWWSFGNNQFDRFSLSGCPNLIYMNPNSGFNSISLKENSTVSSLIGSFSNNPSLLNIPYGLLPYTTDSSVLWSLLENNTSLHSLPNDLLHNFEPTNCQNMCKGMTSLESIPSNFFTGVTSLTNVYGMFENCSGITSNVPELWLNSQYTTYEKCFKGCVNAANYANIPNSWKGL